MIIGLETLLIPNRGRPRQATVSRLGAAGQRFGILGINSLHFWSIYMWCLHAFALFSVNHNTVVVVHGWLLTVVCLVRGWPSE